MFDLLSLLFPRTCFGCNQSQTYLCSNCINQKIDFQPTQKCPICNKPSPNGQTHFRCFTPHCIDGVFALTHKNQLITKLIKELKYRHSSHLINAFAPLIKTTPSQFNSFDLIIPIPLHPIRYKHRGFNQALLLAKLFSEHLKIPINEHLLIRTKLTTPQADIHDRISRINNLKDVFSLNLNFDKKFIENKKILLIDDVTTTGTTLYQACLPLKKIHASTIWGLVLTR